MKIVLPHALNQISGDSGLPTNEMRAWMEQVTDRVNISTALIPPGDTIYITIGNENIIICNNTAPLVITLTVPDVSGHKTTFIRRDAPVTLAPSTTTINGASSVAIPLKYDILDVYYTSEGGEFSA